MDRESLLHFLRSHRWAIEATSSPSAQPQAAIIGVAVTDTLELVFDTLAASRKAANLRANSRIALVIGGWNEADPRTVQYEGKVDFPEGSELERVRAIYFATFEDGPTRLSWPGITYVRVVPNWIRFSDFRTDPPTILEQAFSNA